MATELLKSYYRRESAKSQPSALYETSRPGRKYAEDSAAMKARAKEFFRLSSPDDLLARITVSANDAEATIHMTSQEWPHPSDSMINSVLQALRRGIGQAAPGFPDADFGLSLRLAVSALAKLCEELEVLAAAANDARRAVPTIVAAFRCVFLVFGLTTSAHISDARLDNQHAVGLILDHTMKILIDYDITTEGLPQLDVAASSECTLQDPLRQARSELSPSSQLTWRSESSLATTSSTTLVSRNGLEQHNEDVSSPRGSEVEIPWDPAIELNVANLDPQKSMADQEWLPAQLRIFLDKSDEHRTYRLTVCRGNSHLTEHIIQPASARVVLNYAFQKQPPAIWFEHPIEKDFLCFSPKDRGARGLEVLTELQELFLMDEYDATTHFTPIRSFVVEIKNGQPCEYTNPTVQIWHALPASQASATLTGASQLFIFASPSIFVVPGSYYSHHAQQSDS
ncbi:MAG: hypothetical protein HETSPECPRED_010308 [Heterodermia speciosa]|uniref:Uncharacterized protein n=1 Tax=Heterodermia speciosa TaxID=116794 RepID=A0A8H3IZD0_9LECA|nr:MAG: hypothetical protein HETSPECPRED_010308 [Heterodermia speciosa]